MTDSCEVTNDRCRAAAIDPGLVPCFLPPPEFRQVAFVQRRTFSSLALRSPFDYRSRLPPSLRPCSSPFFFWLPPHVACLMNGLAMACSMAYDDFTCANNSLLVFLWHLFPPCRLIIVMLLYATLLYHATRSTLYFTAHSASPWHYFGSWHYFRLLSLLSQAFASVKPSSTAAG